MSTTLGRIPSTQKIVLDDDPSQKSAAMLRKIDELTAAMKALTAKMDADFADVTNASVDYAASTTDSLADLELTS